MLDHSLAPARTACIGRLHAARLALALWASCHLEATARGRRSGYHFIYKSRRTFFFENHRPAPALMDRQCRRVGSVGAGSVVPCEPPCLPVGPCRPRRAIRRMIRACIKVPIGIARPRRCACQRRQLESREVAPGRQAECSNFSLEPAPRCTARAAP